MWGLNAAVADSSPASSMADAQLMTCGSLLHLVQALAVRFETALPRLWTVTRGAQAVGAVARPIAVAQAPIWALSASIAAEYPDLASVAIDLDPSGPVDAEALVRDITTPDGEDRIAFREGRRFVARLVPAAGAPSPSRAATPFNEAPRVLDIAERGVLDHLQWKAAARRAPGPGEVEIGVAATGLNFRDVLNALGMYEGPAGPFGTECAGTVVGIGPGVADFKVGDEVMAFGGDTFRTFVTLPAALVTRKPSGLSLEEAATIPATFLTAFHALTTLALMSAGDRVLIHAAAGGVGLAAVQLAQRAGAEIFATAGSDEKRQYLRSLGVRHVMSSRTLDFADQIMSLTNGQGVDIVLNSLSGAFIPKSLSALGKGGRFLEIGKKGIWTSRQMAEARPDVAYHAIYLGELEPERIHDMFEELGPAFAARSLAPLRRRVFAADDVVGAFRFMAQAKHIGKIVISHRPESSGQPGSRVRGDASYLITGGYGALGSHVARWLVGAGARHIVLMGRHTPAAEGSIVAELRSLGVDVLAAQGDVAREEDVRRVLAEIERAMPPLAGVIHAAGVVDDGTIAQQDWARFERVAAPKVQGAWNLHLCTRERPIDFFVMFSSMVSMFGAPGQGSYAASNAFLDALAHQRRRDGLPALSIDWGPWAGSGMAGEVDERRHQRWSAQGVDFMAPEEALGILPHLLASQAAQVGVLPVRWGRMLAAFPEGRVPPFLRELERTASAAAPARAKAAVRRDLRAEVERTPAAGRRGVVLACLRDLAVKVLSLDSSQPIDVREPLSELGLDSLMAVELRNSISELVGRSLPATLLFKYPTLAALTDYVLDDVLELSEPDTSEPVGGVDRDLAEVEPLGDEDIKRLLLEELNSLGPDS
jgi:NADPH:quinone reductase-like Zn-dependent oxidoreductase/acyl carrier protein